MYREQCSGISRGWQRKQGKDVSLTAHVLEVLACHDGWKARWKTTDNGYECLITASADALSLATEVKMARCSRYH